MGKKQKLRLFIVRLTGILSAAYSAYYIFVIVRDIRRSSLQGLIIDALVSLLFALLAGFAFTSEVNNLKFIKVRRITFIITLLVIVLLKLRLTGRVFAFLDFTDEYALLVEATDEEPEDGKQECIVCKIVAETDEDGEESESFELVEDESLGQKLVEIFNTKMAEEEEEDE